MIKDIAREIEKIAEELGVDHKRSIGEIAQELNVKTHVIRFWEEKFPQIKPEIGSGGRRYYYNKQLNTLRSIKKHLYEDGYTIAGLQKKLKQRKTKNDEVITKLAKIEDRDMADLTALLEDDYKSQNKKTNIPKETKIKPILEQKFNIDQKLLDFSGIKISRIDADLQHNIETSISEIKTKLDLLKSLSIETKNS